MKTCRHNRAAWRESDLKTASFRLHFLEMATHPEIAVESISVIHVVNRWESGGVRRHVLDLSEGMAARGMKVRIAAYGIDSDAARGIPGIPLPLYSPGGGKSAVGFLRSALILRRAIADGAGAVLHMHSRYATPLGSLTSAGKIAARVYTSHNTFTDLGRLPWYPPDIICPGEAARISFESNARSAAGRRIHVIRHGIALPMQAPFRRPPSTTPTFLFVGRHVEQKGGTVLLEAARLLLRSKAPEFRLRFLGDGPLRRDWMKLADESGLGAVIAFDGEIDDVTEAYRAAAAVVMPSLRLEAMPMTMLEAMSHGCPVVAADLPPFRDVLEKGAGFLFESGNAAALAQALGAILMHPASADETAKRAYERVRRNHDLRGMIESTIAVYQTALSDLRKADIPRR